MSNDELQAVVMMGVKSVILLSGPVGAGKTTIARELVACSPAPVVLIEGDLFWTFVVKEVDSRRDEINFRMIMHAMVSASMAYAREGYEVIVDFSIPPWFLRTARAIAAFKTVSLDYVVVRPSLAVCAERAANRTEGRVADYSQYRGLYDSFDENDGMMIEADDISAAEVAALIRSGLDAKAYRLL